MGGTCSCDGTFSQISVCGSAVGVSLSFRMKFAARFLLLLLPLSPGFTPGRSQAPVPRVGSDGTGLDTPPELSVIWDELQGLNELVLSLKAEEVDGRQSLRTMESRLRDREVEAKQQRRRLDELEETVTRQRERLRSTEERTDADRTRLTELNSEMRREVEQLEERSKSRVSLLQSRLNVSETSVEDLKKKNTALAAELPFLQTRLRASESTVEQLRRKNAVLAARLCNAETLMEELRMQISASSPSEDSGLETRLHVVLEELNTNGGAQRIQPDSLEEKQNTSARDRTDPLSSVETQLEDAEKQLQTENTDQLMNLQRKLNTTERLLDRLSTVQFGLISSVESRLSDASALQLRLGSAEKRVEQLETRSAALESRLRVNEKHLEEVKMETRAQFDQISLLESRLAEQHNSSTTLQLRLGSTETCVEQLETRSAVQFGRISLLESRLTEQHNSSIELQLRLSVIETQLEHLETENTALRVRLNESDARVQQITETNSDELKVAFSAGLTDSGSVGPFDEEQTLVFSKTITNVGRAYDTAAGVFTAPITGVYFFTFTAADYFKGYMGLYLYRNDQPVVFSLDLNDHGGYASTSNGATLQLERGDRVRLSLPASYRLYDDSRNFSVFSGFLLFRL